MDIVHIWENNLNFTVKPKYYKGKLVTDEGPYKYLSKRKTRKLNKKIIQSLKKQGIDFNNPDYSFGTDNREKIREHFIRVKAISPYDEDFEIPALAEDLDIE